MLLGETRGLDALDQKDVWPGAGEGSGPLDRAGLGADD